MSAPTEYKFSGWMGLDNESYKGQLVEGEYEVKPFEENDVDIKISHCGICGTFSLPYSKTSLASASRETKNKD
jgi:hypothetical protein